MLDLGELVARVTVDTRRAHGSLDAFERRLLAVANRDVPDVKLSVVADTDRATSALADVGATALGLPDGDVVVDAATATALSALQGVAAETRGLPDGQLQVDADVSAAERALSGLEDATVAGATGAGQSAGDELASGIITALQTIPVAGAVVGIGAAIGVALTSGLQNEVREDFLVASTGLDPATAASIAQAAGEAYAANFGDSIEGNLDAARRALDAGLLDPAATSRDTQAVIEQLNGVATILGEDVPRVARSAAQAIKTGIAGDATQAFDLLIKAQQAGLNTSEDLLDTVDEYGTQFRKLGLDGPTAVGLLSQAVQAGARDTDVAADALKEFAIRAVDGSDASAAAFEAVGLSAEGMTAKIAAGGDGAKEGLDQVLDGLRAIEDPVLRSEAAVGLFGTQAEDLGDALFAFDASTAVSQLGEVAGAADTAVAAMGDNAAGSIESAKRSIEVAADGIAGALAVAFGDDLSDFAESVSSNREGVVAFLVDMGNAALDMGRALVEGAAAGTEAFGDFVAEAGPPVLEVVGSIIEGLNRVGLVSDDARNDFRTLKDSALEDIARFDVGTSSAADAMRTNLITNGIDPIQERFNELGIRAEVEAALSDQSKRLAGAVSDIGYAADGSQLAVERAGAAFDTTTEAGRALDEQLRTATDALDAQIVAGEEAGRTTEELTADYEQNREALLQQLEAMGFTREEAIALADSYGAIPDKVNTTVTAETAAAAAALEDIRQRIANIRDKNVTITTTQATSYVRQEQAMANRGNANPRTIDRRAKGGPVVRGEDYLVGEEGPEIVTMASDGYVIPAGPTAAILSGGYGQATPLSPPSTTTMTREGDRYDVNIYETSNPRATAREALVELRLAAFEKNGLG